LLSLLALKEQEISVVYEEHRDSIAHVLASRTLIPPCEPLYLHHSLCSELVEEEVVVSLEAEVEMMVVEEGAVAVDC
jgi:hypothetical protein